LFFDFRENKPDTISDTYIVLFQAATVAIVNESRISFLQYWNGLANIILSRSACITREEADSSETPATYS
jgi:hypothetical protein